MNRTKIHIYTELITILDVIGTHFCIIRSSNNVVITLHVVMLKTSYGNFMILY